MLEFYTLMMMIHASLPDNVFLSARVNDDRMITFMFGWVSGGLKYSVNVATTLVEATYMDVDQFHRAIMDSYKSQGGLLTE